jgi:chromosome segregation ATPase
MHTCMHTHIQCTYAHTQAGKARSGPHHLADTKASNALQQVHQNADVVEVQQAHQVAAGLQQRHDDATEPRMHQVDSHTHDQTRMHAHIQDMEAREAHVQLLLDDIRKREKDAEERTTQIQGDKCELDALRQRLDSEMEQRIGQIKAREDELQQLRQRIRHREAELQLQHGQMLQRDVDVQMLRDEIQLLQDGISVREREMDMFCRKVEQCNAEMQLLRDEVCLNQDKLALRDRLEQGLCVVCMEKPADFAVVPCGHKCLCKVDADVMRHRNECPVCRASVHACFQIWPAGV